MSSVASTENVCMFLMNRLYIRDNDKMFSPMGFTACVNEKNETNPLCLNCSCRELQFVRDGGSLISWGNCVQDSNASTCTTPRIFCNSTRDSPTKLRSGSDTSGSTSSRSIVAPLPSSMNRAYTPSTSVPVVDSGSKTPTALIVIAVLSVLLALAAVAFAYIRIRKKRERAFGTPTHTATTYVMTEPPLKVATPRFGTRTKRHTPPRLSTNDLSSTGVRDTFATDDFVSMTSSNGTRRNNWHQSHGRDPNARFKCSFVSDVYMDTMRSMAVDDDVPSRRDEMTGRSQFTVGEDSEEDDQVTVNFGLSTTSAFSSSYWHGVSEESSRASSTSFLEDLSPRKSTSV